MATSSYNRSRRGLPVGIAWAALKSRGIDPERTGWLAAERKFISKQREIKNAPTQILPLRSRLAAARDRIKHEIVRKSGLSNWRISKEITFGPNPACIKRHFPHNISFRLVLPPSAIRVYVFERLQNVDPNFLPYCIESTEHVELTPGMPLLKITKVTGFELNLNLRHNRSQPEIVIDCPSKVMYYGSYISGNNSLDNWAKTRHGLISGVRTRLTNQLVHALGE